MSQFVSTITTSFPYRQGSTDISPHIDSCPCPISLCSRPTNILQASRVYAHSCLCAFPPVFPSVLHTPFPHTLSQSFFPSGLSSSFTSSFPGKTELPQEAPCGTSTSQHFPNDCMSSSPTVMASFQNSPQGSPLPGGHACIVPSHTESGSSCKSDRI